MRSRWPRFHRSGEEAATSSPDRRVADLAGRQHGVVAASQLLELGLTRRMIDRRASSGRLHRVHRGVYAVGHAALSRDARWKAATLACGPGAALSHRSAAAHLGLRDTAATRIEITAPHRAGRTRRGILIHSGATLTVGDVDDVRGVPCTTVARTVFDLASVVSRDALEYALHRAQLRPWSLDLGEVAELLDRLRGHPGTANLRSLLGSPDAPNARAKSGLERAFLRLCRQGGIPRPRVNAWIPLPVPAGGLEVDFSWPDHRLVVETDGASFHATARARRNDPARDRALMLAGWRVARFTWWDITHEPQRVIGEVRALLEILR